MPSGRPTMLDESRQERIISAIRGGNYLKTAAEYAGITYDTLNNWMKRGQAEIHRREKGRDPDESEQIFVNFFEAATRARAEAEARNVALIQQAGPQDWRAAAWFLERSFQETWGKKRYELTGADGGPLEVSDARDELAGRIERLAERLEERVAGE